MRIGYLFLLLLAGCSGLEKTEYDRLRRQNCKGEYIRRSHTEYFYPIENPIAKERDPYPWEDGEGSLYPKITREYFRCKGSPTNPPRIDPGDPKHPLSDCNGIKHGLTIMNGREDIYPVLPELLNFLQKKTQKKVIITCGHRCPIHNLYAEPSSKMSKHMIGAEVDFYVQGMEDQPFEIVNILQQFYQETPRYHGHAEYETFLRYEKDDTGVSTKPWYNKEIFIKVYRENEGRDFDNRHPFPYVSIQVRYDRDKKERVNYSWDRANREYLR